MSLGNFDGAWARHQLVQSLVLQLLGHAEHCAIQVVFERAACCCGCPRRLRWFT